VSLPLSPSLDDPPSDELPSAEVPPSSLGGLQTMTPSHDGGGKCGGCRIKSPHVVALEAEDGERKCHLDGASP